MTGSERLRTRRRVLHLAALVALALPCGASAGAGVLVRAASTNLCTDQLLLTLADDAQILSLSWLASDPEESVLAAAAARHPVNYGTAEELVRLDPDVVLGGPYTRTFALGLLERLGVEVVRVSPADDLDGIARNLRRVGAAIGRSARAERAVAEMQATAERIAAHAPADPVDAVVVRPGGYTVGAGTLADALMRLAGLTNSAAEQGLDQWGSLSIESLLASRPDLIVVVDYHRASPSLANAVFGHPALRTLEQDVATVHLDAAHFACGLPQSLEAARTLEAAARRVANP